MRTALKSGIGFVLLAAITAVLSGCAIDQPLMKIDAKIGVGLSKLEQMDWVKIREKIEPLASSTAPDSVSASLMAAFAKSLSSAQKEDVEAWLKDKNLNRYGDAPETVYAGGTPLFDEVTGETIERFEYIFSKHQELNEIIDQAQK
jgi:hypothetical protein